LARIIPSDLTRLALSGVHEPEMETLALLQRRLPDDYTVFHGIHWSRQYKGRTVCGQFYFVVLNRAEDVLPIKQENGPPLEDEGAMSYVFQYGLFDGNGRQHERSVGLRQLPSRSAEERRFPEATTERLSESPAARPLVTKLGTAGRVSNNLPKARATWVLHPERYAVRK
jgi:hypothetical protein